MAGGTITRITLGDHSTELSGGMIGFYQNTNFFAGKNNRFKAEKTVYGDPGNPPPAGKYFKRGWWTDKDGKSITEALIGDIVHFNIEMTDKFPIKGLIATSLYDDDVKRKAEESDGKKGSDSIELGIKGGQTFQVLNYRQVENRKSVIVLQLGGIMTEMIKAEEDKQIELFFACSYDGEDVELPDSFGDYLKVKEKINYGGAFLFILTDELLPSGKIVRKVVVPPSQKIFDYFKSNQYEAFGMSPPKPLANISIGEHASGLNQSPYLSGSTLPHGAPNIDGSPQYIDIKKAEAAGCKVYSTEEIVADLKRLQEKAPTPEAKARLDKVINAVSNIEKEVLVKGNIPANAIKSTSAMKITKGLRVLNVIGIVITAYELEQAIEKSVQQNSVKPIAAETIRQVGGWGGAIAGAKIGAIGGAAIGIETGPGAIITGAVGALIFGTAGYFGADWVADQIDEN
ncbi:hypothetical protein NZ698_19045 [Chryseobacterium sp. PBS4-4]|uniref:Uncharacterized protein n=1 Tax=Chryseobacterium edaphi TaxID=2976532 RepID=A0ABT2WAQ1_9FLAO|nr:hypothetical protein [Chryseobacterium edaphi]MCU7619282.1 hypothetical protein [Chryseobacterium edaphi]